MLKELTLLGLLRNQKLHGYGLAEYLDNHRTGEAAIGKSNAYRLLHKLEANGLIRSVTERDGKRPERQVFHVTAAGEAYFQEGILCELGERMSSDFPGLVALNYIHEVDAAAASAQLELRRGKVAARHERLRDMPEKVRHLHPAQDLELRHVEAELAWIDETLVRLVAEKQRPRKKTA